MAMLVQGLTKPVGTLQATVSKQLLDRLLGFGIGPFTEMGGADAALGVDEIEGGQ
jgi:hypothetical protein